MKSLSFFFPSEERQDKIMYECRDDLGLKRELRRR